jgi:hypothetical protein
VVRRRCEEHGTESATATVIAPVLGVEVETTGFGPVSRYLLTINPLVNFKRWLRAHFIYWGSWLPLAVVVGVMTALTS